MILYGYCYYNRKAGFYTAPFFNQYNKELMLELLERSFKDSSKEDKKMLLECDFMYLGEFEDKSGIFNLLDKPEFLRNFTEEEKDDKDGK